MTFAQKVLAVVSEIPRGAVMTYKEVAKAAGRPRASRAVGNILNKNPRPMYGGKASGAPEALPPAIEIPCHRVVKSNGEVGGYVGGVRRKIRLLRKEGVTISGSPINQSHRISNF